MEDVGNVARTSGKCAIPNVKYMSVTRLRCRDLQTAVDSSTSSDRVNTDKDVVQVF